MSKHKFAMGVVGDLMKAIRPGTTVMAAAGVGAVAAQLGGALLKEVDVVNAFALQGQGEEMLVDLAGGLAIDAGLLVGAGMLWGPKSARQLAPFLVGGTALSAVAPIAAPYLAEGIDYVIDMVAGKAATGTFESRTRTALGLPPRPAGTTITMPRVF